MIREGVKKIYTDMSVNVTVLKVRQNNPLIFFLYILYPRALKEFVGSIDSNYAKERDDFFVGLEGSFGAKHVTSRTLTSRLLGSLVCLEGIVTKCSQVKNVFIWNVSRSEYQL